MADYYRFELATSDAVHPEPNPDVDITVSECPGAVRFHWVDVSGNPVAITSGLARALRRMVVTHGGGSVTLAQANDRLAPGSSEMVFVVHGDGQPFELQVDYTIGSDPFTDMVKYRYKKTLAVGCDEVVDISHVAGDCDGDGTGQTSCSPLQLGSVSGDFDIVGEDEHHLVTTPIRGMSSTTTLRALTGPWDNERFDNLESEPSQGSYFLANLMPSEVEAPPKPYAVGAKVSIRSGDRFEVLDSPSLDTLVGCGEDVSLGDAFVMHPAWLSGDIFLAGPPPAAPPILSPLHHLKRATDPERDADGDGIPDRELMDSVLYNMSNVGITPPTATNLWTSTSFAGSMDAAGGTFSGDYDMVVVSPRDLPRSWNQSRLRLRLADTSDPTDELRYLSNVADLKERYPSAITIAPGDRVVQDKRYCMASVHVIFEDRGGLFTHPSIDAGGGLIGTDFEGRDRAYDAMVHASGTPTLSSAAANHGLVNLAIPEGRYTINPQVSSQNPGGGTSSTQILPFGLGVGCRQDIWIYPDVIGKVDSIGPCADEGSVLVTGHVEGTAVIDRVEWTLNGSAPTAACTSCGVAPSFSFSVPVALEPNTILVRAVTTDAREVSVTSYTLPAREPSATDRRPMTEPLLVRKDPASGLALTWENVPGAAADVYRGTIDAFHTTAHYDHSGFGACGVMGGSATVAMPGGNSYFVVSGACGWGDGSVGRDSKGRELPRPLNACVP